MNALQLRKALDKLIEQGHGRKPVCIDKSTFRHPLEADGVAILGCEHIEGPRFIGMCDDDGGTKWNQDGSESGRNVILLTGEKRNNIPAPKEADRG